MTAKSTAKPVAKSASKSATPDAITLLKKDHAEVKTYFDEYENLESDKDKKALAGKICTALKVHMQIEEEIFYPAARKAIKDNELLDEATVEHSGAKILIAEIEAMKPSQNLYDAKVKVLGEQIEHHVKEEEDELFPEVRGTDLDLEALGTKMAKRKAELMKKMATAAE